jgi:16S rRNA (cytidine1402-2'-O)-methyltransferase
MKKKSRAASGRSGDDGREPIEPPSGSKSGGRKSADPTASTGAEVESSVESLTPGLYLVATPIGHLGDITLRAIAVLRRADLIACEDTRVTETLARRYGLSARRVPYHDHNARAMRPKLVARLRQGGAVALVSDAGTPLVSDPGYKLVQAALAENIAVTAIPGASAPLAALMVAGLPTDRFFFAGFLPAKPGPRRRALQDLAAVPATLLFFEAANRLADSLAEMAAVLGDRMAAVARELTKLHEEVRRGSLAGLARHYAETGAPKGEIVVAVGPPDAAASKVIGSALDRELAAALDRLSVSEASAMVAATTGMPRRQVYARALALAGKRPRAERE